MDADVKYRGKVDLPFTEETYRGNIHSTIPASFAQYLRNGGGEALSEDLSDFEPSEIYQELKFENNGIVAEDCLMHDTDDDSYILMQGKSYHENIEEGIIQLINQAPTLRRRDNEIHDNLKGLYLVTGRLSGIEEPREDFDSAERAIREEIGWFGHKDLKADVYQIKHEEEEVLPMGFLN